MVGRQFTLDSFGGGTNLEDAQYRGFRQDAEGFVLHPLLKTKTLGAYSFQLALANRALLHDTLIVLPTGLGKTVVAALVVAERMRTIKGKVLFLAPTKPLVIQHSRSLSGWFTSLPRAVFTGEVSSPVREGSWDAASVVFSTPELIVRDLVDGRYSLKDVELIVYDEAHHARGKYAYTKIATIYASQGPECRRSLALTASPGDTGDILKRLNLSTVEARDREDPDVASYVQSVTSSTVKVHLGEEHREIAQLLRDAAHADMVKLQRYGLLRTRKLSVTSVKDLVDARRQLWAMPGRQGMKFQAMALLTTAQHMLHCLELVEREGLAPFLGYVDRLASQEKLKRSDKKFLENKAVQEAMTKAKIQAGTGNAPTHPKMDELLRVIDEELASNPQAKIIVFAEYRDSVSTIVKDLRSSGVRADRFVGQTTRSSTDKGMLQKQQMALLEAFKSGKFNVMVASRVAEEGIDIPQVDLVVEYDVLPSDMRTIQRRGRTGRTTAGKVISLMTEGTKEERYRIREMSRRARARRTLRSFNTL